MHFVYRCTAAKVAKLSSWLLLMFEKKKRCGNTTKEKTRKKVLQGVGITKYSYY